MVESDGRGWAACSRRRRPTSWTGGDERAKTRRPIVIEHVRPAVDGGRFPVKREVGDASRSPPTSSRRATICSPRSIRFRAAGEADWREAPLEPGGQRRWGGVVPAHANTRYRYTVEAWTDVFGSWVEEMRRRLAGGPVRSRERAAEGAAHAPARARARARRGRRRGSSRALERLEAAASREPPPRRPARRRISSQVMARVQAAARPARASTGS